MCLLFQVHDVPLCFPSLWHLPLTRSLAYTEGVTHQALLKAFQSGEGLELVQGRPRGQRKGIGKGQGDGDRVWCRAEVWNVGRGLASASSI